MCRSPSHESDAQARRPPRGGEARARGADRRRQVRLDVPVAGAAYRGARVAVIADLDPERARAACRNVGWDEARIARTRFVTAGKDACDPAAVDAVVEATG